MNNYLFAGKASSGPMKSSTISNQISKPKIAKNEVSGSESDNSEDEDSYGDEDEQEEGQIKLPDGIIKKNIKELEADKSYLIVYIRQKTDEEIADEKDVSYNYDVVRN